MRHVSVREFVPEGRVKRYLDLAPFAITSDGAILINVAAFAGTEDLDELVLAAKVQSRGVFVGVMLTSEEMDLAMARLDNAAAETAARIVGRRRKRRPNGHGR
jgi:hypothetical protein